MNNKIIILIVFIIVLCGVLGFIYLKYQKPFGSQEYVNLSISAESNGKKIITGFKVGDIYGNTSQDYELVQVPKNQNYVNVENVNLPNQFYYKTTQTINLSDQPIVRVDLDLKEFEEPMINITDGNPVNVTITSKDFRDLQFCLTSSLNYIFLDIPKQQEEFVNLSKGKENLIIKSSQYNYAPENWSNYKLEGYFFADIDRFTQISKISGYENWDKCYDTKVSLNDNAVTIPVKYREFGKISEKDYIKIVIITPEFLGIKNIEITIK